MMLLFQGACLTSTSLQVYMAPTKLYFPIDLVVVCRELCDVTTTLWPVKGGIIINGMCGVVCVRLATRRRL